MRLANQFQYKIKSVLDVLLITFVVLMTLLIGTVLVDPLITDISMLVLCHA